MHSFRQLTSIQFASIVFSCILVERQSNLFYMSAPLSDASRLRVKNPIREVCFVLAER